MIDDPRDLGGDIAGPGGPRDRGGVVISTQGALNPDSATIAMIEDGEQAGKAAALVLEGEVVGTGDRARLLVLLGPDAAAAVVTEIAALAVRADGQPWAEQFGTDATRRFEDLDAEGLL